ncbi:MAG: anti-sigma factor [Ekhidna sp.]
MNVEAYISSGILEAYALGELSGEERAAVEQVVEENPEVKNELRIIEESFEALAFSTQVRPPKGVKDSLLNQVGEAPVIPMQPEKEPRPFLRYAAAASILIAIGSMLLAFNFWSKWKGAEDRLATLLAQNQQFADNYNLVNQQLDNLQDAIAIMNNKSYKRIIMNGTDNAPQSVATVYWNETNQSVYLSIQNLKALSQDQQYQLWAIIDGVPVDAGVFDVNSEQLLVEMNNIGGGAAAFAVTIEPRGGSVNPSLETMQVVGNV